MGLATLVLLTACGGLSETEPTETPTATSVAWLPWPTANPTYLSPPGRPTRIPTPVSTVTSEDAWNAEKHYIAGVEFQEQGRLEEAIADYDEAIRLDPQYAEAHSNRGAAYVGLGQYQRAIQDLDEAIRLDPQLAMAYGGRAWNYTALGDDEKAQEDIERAVELGFDRDMLVRLVEEAKQLR